MCVQKERLEEAGFRFWLKFEHVNFEMPVYIFWVGCWTWKYGAQRESREEYIDLEFIISLLLMAPFL